MYQSFVYLETRILLSPVPSVFFIEKNGTVTIDSEVLRKVFAFTHALGSCVPDMSPIEHLTGNLPEQPDGKKITGYSVRAGEGGTLNILFHSRPKTIHVEEIRIEEDSGRLTHADGNTRMDFTWSGCPSIRLRTTPSFELGEEVELFLDELRRLVQYLHLVNPEAVEGGIRCNAFAALSKYPELPDYYVKLRNLNSFNFARKAVNSELTRQENILSAGGIVASESRLWNEKQSRTETYKSRNSDVKRFEPLDPPQVLDLKKLSAVFRSDTLQTELPAARRERLYRQYKISRLHADFLCDDKDCADFFEQTVAQGIDPTAAVQWMISDVSKILRARKSSYADTLLTPVKFASVLKKLTAGQINGQIGRQLLQEMAETGGGADEIISEHGITLLAREEDLIPYVDEVIERHPALCARLRSGEMPPLEFLTGQVMQQTGGMAVPQTVKALIKKRLKISIVYVFSMGGAMSAQRHEDGSICSGDPLVLRRILSESVPEIPAQVIPVGHFLSEEIEPADWAALIRETAVRIAAGTANGIVITHGTDTLSYTAALMYWLFSDASVPIVLTASSTLPSESSEASDNLVLAVQTACEKTRGVYVVYGGKVLSPLNLRFERPARDGFRNWNLKRKVFAGSGPVADQFGIVDDPDAEVMKRILQDAASRMVVCRAYPGFNSAQYIKLLDESVHTVFLELYETGTGNMRSDDFSLKPFLLHGRRNDVKFYCSSQQESSIDFSQYVTEMRVWREGAVPMGILTIESAMALYFACSLVADTEEERDNLMEAYAEVYTAGIADS
ncbi:MAG: asparaginase domain-containing protein [Treponema sp.]|jgi:aspartyl-tRNA(Asn)/glutamyl-tRNA(Gln) amidotransferase subunit B|nr:asparaginase domain-containing protein [Treponema sp.]